MPANLPILDKYLFHADKVTNRAALRLPSAVRPSISHVRTCDWHLRYLQWLVRSPAPLAK